MHKSYITKYIYTTHTVNSSTAQHSTHHWIENISVFAICHILKHLVYSYFAYTCLNFIILWFDSCIIDARGVHKLKHTQNTFLIPVHAKINVSTSIYGVICELHEHKYIELTRDGFLWLNNDEIMIPWL